LKQRHVSFTRTAQQHVAQEKAWWLENRDYPEVFVEELEQALKGGRSASRRGQAICEIADPRRRVYLRRVALHLYYTFNDDVVLVRALWGARRERGPQLEP
jgi:hypothetical protein